ncbi:MAG: GvpL/GvpF family gas vesicle protein, partial [Actinomycetota bacterium]|nr:GvpL/GvpF family gas vesicle protein [Actinomycetota bacterium]
MVYVYAVTEPRRHPPSVPGLDGDPLRAVSAGELTAVVSDRDEAQLDVTEDALWAHERVVESLLDEGAVLPMRFGSVLPDDAAVQAMFSQRGEEFADGLQRVRGAVELGVRAAWDLDVSPADDREPVSQGPGAAYIR